MPAYESRPFDIDLPPTQPIEIPLPSGDVQRLMPEPAEL